MKFYIRFEINVRECKNGFIKNFFSESPQWLEEFCNQFSDWSGLSLVSEENTRLRSIIMQKTPSLLDVRNYMFARQSQLLLHMSKHWEVNNVT